MVDTVSTRAASVLHDVVDGPDPAWIDLRIFGAVVDGGRDTGNPHLLPRAWLGDAPCYLLLPEESAMSPTVIHGGFVALFRKRPPMQDGYRLLEVKVRRRRQRDKTPPWSAERRRVGGGIP